MVLVTW
jgi:hypothetical protein